MSYICSEVFFHTIWQLFYKTLVYNLLPEFFYREMLPIFSCFTFVVYDMAPIYIRPPDMIAVVYCAFCHFFISTRYILCV